MSSSKGVAPNLYYTFWLDKKMDIPKAFRAAQQEVKQHYPSPFYWGAFVLLQ